MRCPVFIACTWIASAPTAVAGQIILPATADTSIYSESNNSNGAGQGIFAGNNSAGNTRRALIATTLLEAKNTALSLGERQREASCPVTLDVDPVQITPSPEMVSAPL